MEITDAVIKLIECSQKFTTYSNARNDHAVKLLDNFARNLFAWRRPFPKFGHIQARSYHIFGINSPNLHLVDMSQLSAAQV